MIDTYLPVKAANIFATGLTNIHKTGGTSRRGLVENCVWRGCFTDKMSFFIKRVQFNVLLGCNTR